MAMTVVVTRNAPGRVSGFLASCMCEIGPGVYTAPRMNRAVRERVWRVLSDWHAAIGDPDLAVVMTWRSPNTPGGQEILTLGVPRRRLVKHGEVYLAMRDLQPGEIDELHEPSMGPA